MGAGEKGGTKAGAPGVGGAPGGSCGLCPPQTSLLPWDGGFLSTLSLKTEKSVLPHSRQEGCEDHEPKREFASKLFQASPLCPHHRHPGATSRFLTTPLTILPHSQTDCFKINELTSVFLPTGQLAGLPKQHYLLRPDPPPPPRRSQLARHPPTPRDGCRLPPALPPPIFWPKSRLKASLPGHGCSSPYPRPPGSESPLRTLETRPPAVRGPRSFRGRHPRPPAAPAPGRDVAVRYRPALTRRERAGGGTAGGSGRRASHSALKALLASTFPRAPRWAPTPVPQAPRLPGGTARPPQGGSWCTGHGKTWERDSRVPRHRRALLAGDKGAAEGGLSFGIRVRLSGEISARLQLFLGFTAPAFFLFLPWPPTPGPRLCGPGGKERGASRGRRESGVCAGACDPLQSRASPACPASPAVSPA